MFAAMVSEKRNGSCWTKPTLPRSTASGIWRTSRPSMNTVPGGGSWSRASRLISVDFPDPVGPTSATVWPAGTRAEIWRRTGTPPYEKLRSRNSTSPRSGPMGITSDRASEASSRIAGTASSTASNRVQLAMPRWTMFVTQPNAIIGQASIIKYALNATNWPSVIRPRMTSRLPSQSTSMAPRPRRKPMLGKKKPWSAMSRRLRRTSSSLTRRNRSSSAASCR